MPETTISAEVEPTPNRANRAALALQRLGFRVLHIGTTISVEGPQPLWESLFNVSFKPRKKSVLPEIDDGEVTYQEASAGKMRFPTELEDLVAEVVFVEPPELLGTAI